MYRLFIVICALVLSVACIPAHAKDAENLQQQYSHIQDLNNAGSDLVYTRAPTPAQLRTAIVKLKRAQAAIEKMQSGLAATAWFAPRTAARHEDNLRFQADAYAQLGNNKAALNCLEAWAAGDVGNWGRHWLVHDKYLDGLRGNPRFKATGGTTG